METIAQRLKKLRTEELKTTTREFAAAVKYTEPSVNLFENGKRVPTDKYIKAVCRAFNVSEAWLRDGAGPMFGASDSTDNDLSGIASERDNAVKAFFYGMFSKLDPAEKKTILNALLDSMKK